MESPIASNDPFSPARWPGVTFRPPTDSLHTGIPALKDSPTPHSTSPLNQGCVMCGSAVKVPTGPFRLSVPASVTPLGTVEVWTLKYGSPDYEEQCWPTLVNWCERNHYVLRTHDGRGYEVRQFAKVDMVSRFLEGKADWFLFVDGDCILHPLAPSIFEAVTEPGIWALPDLASTARKWDPWLENQGIERPLNHVYRNSGVFAMDRESARKFVSVAKEPFLKGFLEQHHHNLWFSWCGASLHDLPDRWNSFRNPTAPAWCFHLAGRRKHERIAELRRNGRLPDVVKRHTPKTRIPDFGKGAVVWPWKSTAAEWDELRYSFLSVRKFWSEKDWPCVLLGDAKPDWWTGEFVKCDEYAEALTVGLNCAERILWMNDDIFMLAPQSPETLSVAREMGDLRSRLGETMVAQNTWRRGLGQVLMRLHHHGKPTRNFSTHTPYLYERERAREVLEVFGAYHKIPFETAYYNWHGTPWTACVEKSRGPHDMKGRLWINPAFRQVTPEFRKFMDSLISG